MRNPRFSVFNYSADKKQFDIGTKLSQAHLHEGDYEEAFSVCERLMQLPGVSDEDADQLSLCRVVASAAVASSHVCTNHRQPLVSIFGPGRQVPKCHSSCSCSSSCSWNQFSKNP